MDQLRQCNFFYIKQAEPSTRHRIIELQGQEKKIKMLRSRCLNGEDSHNEYKHHANNKLFFAWKVKTWSLWRASVVACPALKNINKNLIVLSVELLLLVSTEVWPEFGQEGKEKARVEDLMREDCRHYLFYVPEGSFMHLTVLSWLLLSSGRGGGENRRGTMGGVDFTAR